MVDSMRARVLTIAALAAAFFLPSLYPITDNELFTWWTCRHGLDQLLRIATEDIRSPVYYLAARTWSLLFGESLHALRAFSGACSFLSTIGAGLLYAWQPKGEQAGRVREPGIPHFVWLLLALNASTIYYSHLAGMSALLGLLGIAAACATVQCWRAPESRVGWVLLTVLATLLASTHIYSTIITGAFYGWLLVELVAHFGWKTKHLRSLALSITICGTVVSPTLVIVIRQAVEIPTEFWTPRVAISAPAVGLAGYFLPVDFLAISKGVSVIAIIVTAVVCCVPWRLSAFERLFVFQIAVATFVVFAGGVFGGEPNFVLRNLQPLHPLACVFVASRIGVISRQTVRRVFWGLFLLSTLCCSIGILFHLSVGKRPNEVRQNEKAFCDASLILREMNDESASIICIRPLPFLRYRYYAGPHSGRVFLWNPEEDESVEKDRREYLSTIRPYARLSHSQIREHKAEKLILVDTHNVDLEIPGWVPITPQPEFANDQMKIKMFVRQMNMASNEVPSESTN